LFEIDKLKGELVQKDEDLAREIEASKQDAAQSYLVGFEVAKFLIVVIDYFTKWIEPQPLATIIAQ